MAIFYESTLKLLVNAKSVSRVTVLTVNEKQKNKFVVKFQIGTEEILVSSKRERVRTWAKLDTVVSFLKEMGISDAELKIA